MINESGVRDTINPILNTTKKQDQKLSTFVLAKYRIGATLIQSFTFKGYKGSIFHGGFGHALKSISSSTYQTLYQPPYKGDPPKPYIIVPPLDDKTHYQVGDTITFELILIGPAVQHFPICFAAFEKLGELGIGKERAKFTINQIDYFNELNQPQNYFKNGHWQFIDTTINGNQLAETLDVSAELNEPLNEKSIQQITLNFTTYLRLKNNAKLVNETPSFHLLMDRLLGRLCTLGKYYGREEALILHRNERLQLLTQAESISSYYNNMKWQDWTRYSGRQQTEMKFGGLTGTVQYRGELTPFIPYLKLGQWLHVGGKTSFGLGKYEIIIE